MLKAVAALLVVLSSGPVRAAPPGEPPVEGGLAAQQIVLGTVSGLFAGAGATALGMGPRSDAARAISGALFATAVLPGLAVCAVGGSSPWYDGSCAGPIVGAVLGSLLVGLPLGRLTEAHRDTSGSLLVTSVALSALGAGLGATLGWHAFKHRRRPPARAEPAVLDHSPRPSLAWPEMPVQRLAVPPGTFAAPVLAFSF